MAEEYYVYRYKDGFVIMDVKLPLITEQPAFTGTEEECKKWVEELKEKEKMDDVYKVRFHRGGLAESMETYFEPKDWKDFLEHCKAESEDIILRSIKCELYDKDPDDRIGWKQTWILTSRCRFDNGLKRYPFGFCDRDIMQLK